MKKIEQNKIRKRQNILRSAERVFLSEGYVRANMDRIADGAGVTKQTVYRYFPSKIVLFEQTLRSMSEGGGTDFFHHLDNPDIAAGLCGFAVDYIHIHIRDVHLQTMRLLIAEGGQAPEITSTFAAMWPQQTKDGLVTYFRDKLGVDEPEQAARMWTGMLLVHRNNMLMGHPRPTDQEILDHATAVTDLLLNGIHK